MTPAHLSEILKGVFGFVAGVVSPTNGAASLYLNGQTIALPLVCTFANLPLPSAYTGRAFVTDIGGGTMFVSNGALWYPQGLRTTIYDIPAANAVVVGTSAKILAQNLIPPKLWKDRDILRITYTETKSAAVESSTHNFRIGTAGLVTDTSLAATTAPGTTNISVGNWIDFIRLSATSIQRMGTGVVGGMNGVSTSAIGSPITVPDMDVNPLYLSYTAVSSASSETYTLHAYNVELRSHGPF